LNSASCFSRMPVAWPKASWFLATSLSKLLISINIVLGIHASEEGCCCRFLLPIECGGLRRRLASVAELLLPSWIELGSNLLECQEGTFDLLMSLGILDDAIGKRHVAEFASLPLHPNVLALTARDAALLGSILVAEGTTASGK
jgi:hypothetical protein